MVPIAMSAALSGLLLRLLGPPAGLTDAGLRPEVRIDAEDGEYETRIEVTLFDRAPEWRRVVATLRRLVP